MKPNDHFLYQLAVYEIKLGKGSSVFRRKEWDIYEYNAIKDSINIRPSLGIFRAVWRLYEQHNANSKIHPPELSAY